MHKLTYLTLSGAIAVIGVTIAQQTSGPAQWPLSGNDASNSRSQPLETRIGAANVSGLAPRWTFITGGDVSTTPTVADGIVYVPDWAGNLYAIGATDGHQVWSRKISEYTGQAGSISRVSPAVYRDLLILGDNVAQRVREHNGANIMAVDRATGALRWITRVDPHPAAIITGQPAVQGDVVYIGVSSNEEALAQDNSYMCCTFRGSVAALNAATGAILWRTFVVPENGGFPDGYSGNAVWQPPAIDAPRGLLYVGVGNNYTVPEEVKICEAAPLSDPNQSPNCTPPANYVDSALALDLKTGQVKWSQRLRPYDAWTVACNGASPGRNCPAPAGPDYDLGGSGPNLTAGIIGFGQKSGVYWALNPGNGNVAWSTMVGPGGTLGGIEWGTASDGQRIYAAIGNNSHKPYSLARTGREARGGSWAALDVATGRILWQTADPAGATDPGAVSVANGVVYAGSYSGGMYAMDASTGAILWSFDSGGSVLDGPAIVDGMVFWGSGYRKIAPGTGNNKLYAFSFR